MASILRTKPARWILSILLVAGVAVAVSLSTRGYPTASEATATSKAGRVEAVPGTKLSKVILTKEAVARLDIQTAMVSSAPIPGSPQLAIPYSALLYDPTGDTWTYTNPEPLTYLRQKVAVESIQGNLAFLTAGPPGGTAVVTVGAAELYGTEVGVGK
jgi:hypothetical protein